MNTTLTRRAEIAAHNYRTEEAIAFTNDMLAYIASPKFHGHDNNYVNAEEVARILLQIREILSMPI